MINGEIHNPEQVEANIKPFTADEFNNLLSERRHTWRESEAYLGSDGHMDVDKFHEFYDVETRKLIEELTKELGRFKYIFQTAKGSAYFVLNTGESQRIKCSKGKFDSHSIGPLLNDLFFVPDLEFERIMKLVKDSYRGYDALLGIPIEEASLVIGNHPVEMNMHHAPANFNVFLERSGNHIVLKAQKHEWDGPDEQGQISNGIHVGNAVVNIVKGL